MNSARLLLSLSLCCSLLLAAIACGPPPKPGEPGYEQYVQNQQDFDQRQADKRAARDQARSERTAPAQEVPAGDDTGIASESYTCCINGAFHVCPDAAALQQCVGQPSDLASCLMSCDAMAGADCEQGCGNDFGPRPGACDRQPDNDPSCR